MPRRERSYETSSGKPVILRSERTINADASGWELTLELYAPGRLRRKLRARRKIQKSGEWSTSAILLLQAQEELELLSEFGVELQIFDLLDGA